MFVGIGGLIILVLDIIALMKLWGGSSSAEHKLIWTLIILLLPVIGMLLYFLIGQSSADA